jgi:hypothetical protein
MPGELGQDGSQVALAEDQPDTGLQVTRRILLSSEAKLRGHPGAGNGP